MRVVASSTVRSVRLNAGHFGGSLVHRFGLKFGMTVTAVIDGENL